jgi:arylsulfatase A-like enzyme
MSGDMGESARRKLQTPKNNVFLPEQVYTLAELLHDHGYATAHIGKWNLGHGAVRGPEGQGFDINIGGHRGGVGESLFMRLTQKSCRDLQGAPAGAVSDRSS